MSRAWRRGSTTAWRRCKRAVHERDQAYYGRRCLTGPLLSGDVAPFLRHLVPHLHLLKQSVRCTGSNEAELQAHHVLGAGRTGLEQRWVITCCRECNLSMGDPMRRDPKPMSVTRW